MAEVDFGDRQLFEQLDDSAPAVPQHIRFTDDEEEQDEVNHLRSRLEGCDDYIQRLTEENKGLRRKLHILSRPSGITVQDINIDGPVLQILYANNIISKQCRQEIEDSICNVILKHQQLGNETKKNTFHIKPQSSAFALDEDQQKMSSSGVRTTSESFKVVGSVLYFTSFSVDKLGQPLVNESTQMTDGWEVPTYNQVFNQVIGTDGVEIEMKDKRPKSMCFNCGMSSHQLKDCPKPKDMAAINERRREFNQANNQAMQSNQRYHAEEVEERFAKYKAGVMRVHDKQIDTILPTVCSNKEETGRTHPALISLAQTLGVNGEELLAALGIDGNTIPPLIYRMRQLGYPPGWLKEAEMENSGLALYDGNGSNEGNADGVNSQNISYDVSRLVDFPGFNVPAPNMRDDFMLYNSIPMQSSHMKQNYAAYLSNNFPMPGANSNKRQHESDSSPQLRKKTRSSPDRTSDRSSDMDIESDPGTPYHNHGPGDFQFQPPLPPGSPCFSSPPPLPQGTPPATPTPPPLPKGTPPPTPTNGSPALRGRAWTGGDEAAEGTEDELTLEELEEQQRLIWAALENTETTTNSDSETPVMGTPVPSSPSVSTPVHIDTENEEAEEVMDTTKNGETCPDSGGQKEPEFQSLRPIKVEEDSPQSPEPVKVKTETPLYPCSVKVEEDSPQSPDPIKLEEDSPQRPNEGHLHGAEDCASPEHAGKVAAVPHRSLFAAGIVPFEDTPEFTEVAEATGTYLKIRDLLKSSPRNLAKKK